MYKRTPQLLIQDILESCHKIIEYSDGMTYDDFIKDSKRLMQLLEILK